MSVSKLLEFCVSSLLQRSAQSGLIERMSVHGTL